MHPSSCGRPSLNGPASPYPSARGQRRITSSNEPQANTTRPPCAPSPSNGSASYGDAGRTVSPITKPATSPLFARKNHRWMLASPSPDFACSVVLRCWFGTSFKASRTQIQCSTKASLEMSKRRAVEPIGNEKQFLQYRGLSPAMGTQSQSSALMHSHSQQIPQS